MCSQDRLQVLGGGGKRWGGAGKQRRGCAGRTDGRENETFGVTWTLHFTPYAVHCYFFPLQTAMCSLSFQSVDLALDFIHTLIPISFPCPGGSSLWLGFVCSGGWKEELFALPELTRPSMPRDTQGYELPFARTIVARRSEAERVFSRAHKLGRGPRNIPEKMVEFRMFDVGCFFLSTKSNLW